jgi:hypothetical protein
MRPPEGLAGAETASGTTWVWNRYSDHIDMGLRPADRSERGINAPSRKFPPSPGHTGLAGPVVPDRRGTVNLSSIDGVWYCCCGQTRSPMSGRASRQISKAGYAGRGPQGHPVRSPRAPRDDRRRDHPCYRSQGTVLVGEPVTARGLCAGREPVKNPGLCA